MSDETDESDESVETDEHPLLEVLDLEMHYPVTTGLLRREVGRVRAVDGVSFELDRGTALGVVGESGSGKTTLAHAILRLEEPTGGSVRFDGRTVGDLADDGLRAFRRRVQLVVQDPTNAFNPRSRVGEAVAEPLTLHGMTDEDRQRAIVADLLDRVGLAPEDADRYPHEFSTGELQRISVARALAPDPDLIVADEPTSALDGRVKSDVLALLDEVRRDFDISILFVSHDIDVVRRFCDDVAVMYLGEFVETGRTEDVLHSPAHPYTRVLLGSVPSLDPADRSLVRPLTDTVPDPADPPSGCRFHTRCPEVIRPDDVELPPDTWRTLAAFRFTVHVGELPEEIDLGLGDARVDESLVRDAFDLPERIPDEAVARGVDEAVAAVATGDLERARETLSATLPTVCERETPATVDADGRTVRCHRYDPDSAGEPLPWTEQ